MDNGKKKSAQELEENLDLVMENDNRAAGPVVIFQAASPTSSLAPYEDHEDPDAANSWD